MKFDTKILKVCLDIYRLLLQKNQAYGNSASDPLRIFSKTDKLEQIRVRMDDKLSRIKNQTADDSEDAYQDLLGYLVIYQAEKYYGQLPDRLDNVYVVNSDVLYTLDKDGKQVFNEHGIDLARALSLDPSASLVVLTKYPMGEKTTELIQFLKSNDIFYKLLACRKPDDKRPDTEALPELFENLRSVVANPACTYTIIEDPANTELMEIWKNLKLPVWSLSK